MASEKITLLILATATIVGLCWGSPLKLQYNLEDRWSVLKCENGNLTGVQQFTEIFQNISVICSKTETTSQFFNCYAEVLGVTDEDGTPNTVKIDDFFVTIFSEIVLEDVPQFKEDLSQCGADFVSNYNGIEEAGESAQTFLRCFTDTIQNYGETIDKVCKYEHAFNGNQ